VSSSFLIFHVVGQNLSSTELDAISRALTRPRNRIRGCTPQHPDVTEIGQHQPLKDIVSEAIRLLSQGGIKSEFHLEPGGYLERNKTSESPGSDDQELTTHRPQPARPMRVTCAIPWPEAPPPPAPEEFSDDDGNSAWSVFDSWAWALSTGADRFHEAIPARTVGTRDMQRMGEHEYWTLWGSSYGVSVVRKPGGNWTDEINNSVFMKDPSLWMLASTRFVDLCLLTQRCTLALHYLDSRLAIEDTELEEQLDSFTALQSQFLAFRNQLWFDVVSDHGLVSLVHAGLRKQTGQLSMYTDLRDEIEIRREIYDTRHAIRSVQEQNNRAARDGERQDERDRLNIIIGITAVILAVPAIAETTGVTPSWEYFTWVFAIMLCFALAIIGATKLLQSRRHRRGSEPVASGAVPAPTLTRPAGRRPGAGPA
jgi:hypothetical protein